MIRRAPPVAPEAHGAPDAVESRVDVRREVERHTVFKLAAVAGLLAVVAIVVSIATSVGTASLEPLDVLRSITARLLPFVSTGLNPVEENILWELRLPRIIMGVLAGFGLALAGGVMQGVLRNPLASPFTLGISSAAAFGASLAIVFGAGVAGTGAYVVVGSAFIFAMLCAAIVYAMSWWRGMSPETIILAGIALTYLFGALTAVLQFMASEQQLQNLVNWTFGSLTGSTWSQIGIVALLLGIAFPPLMRYAWSMNAMASGGEEVARSLGVHTSRVRLISTGLCVLVTAAIISFTGIIGFVGLVGPHIARSLVGGDHRFLLPFGGLAGSVLLVTSDTLGRTIFAPAIIPVGIVVSFIGVPLFAHLILTRRKEYFR